MDWRDIPSLSALRAFEAAARTGSLSAAARELNVTHAAIAQHVRTLETHFGTALLIRDGQRMAATGDGATLAAALGEGFTAIATGVRDLIDRDKARPLRVATTPAFAAHWLMPRIGRFWTSHPDIDLEVIPNVDVIDLRKDNVDVAIRYGRGGWPGVAAHPILPAGIVVTAIPSVAGERKVTDLSALSGKTWLIDSSLPEAELFARSNGVDLANERVVTFATPLLAREAALAGLGVTLLPDPLIRGEIEAGRMVELFREENSPVSYHVVTRPGVVAARRDAFVRWLMTS